MYITLFLISFNLFLKKFAYVRLDLLSFKYPIFKQNHFANSQIKVSQPPQARVGKRSMYIYKYTHMRIMINVYHYVYIIINICVCLYMYISKPAE